MTPHEPSRFTRHALKAVAQMIRDLTRHATYEIRGRLTREMLQNWIDEHLPEGKDCLCALSFDVERQQATVYLIDRDNEPVYGATGERIAATFAARKLDSELARWSARSATIVIDPLTTR